MKTICEVPEIATAILQKLRSADNLPSLPTVAIDVLNLTKKDDVSIDELAGVIQNDPALAGRFLKVVNSPLYSLPRKIGSIKQAVGLLGLRAVKVMALSFSLVDALGDSKTAGFDFQGYWRRSLTTGVAARLLAKAVAPRLAEEAFVAGLLSDTGRVAAWRCIQQMYERVLDTWANSRRPLADIERDQLGLTNAEMGRHVLRTWGLPETLCDGVGTHDGQGLEALSGPSLELAKIVHSGAAIAAVFSRDIPLSELNAVKEQCRTKTGIDETKFEEMLAALDQHVLETASMLAVDIGKTTSYAQLQADATMQLTQLSMQAEVERAHTARREQQARQETERLYEEKKAILEVASRDGLTKLANRAAFDQRLDEELRRTRETGHPLALILLDVDHFKKFNDTYGHQAGDEVLRITAACLRKVIHGRGFAARYGGEEFVVIMVSQTPEAVRAMAEEIRQTIEMTIIEYDSHQLRVTASLGVSCEDPPTPNLTCAILIKHADEQLYKAKGNGRNRVEMVSFKHVGV